MLRSKNVTKRPRCCTPSELSKVGVEVLPVHPGLWLQCTACLERWSPLIRPGGKLPRGYWQCPRGCNHPE